MPTFITNVPSIRKHLDDSEGFGRACVVQEDEDRRFAGANAVNLGAR